MPSFCTSVRPIVSVQCVLTVNSLWTELTISNAVAADTVTIMDQWQYRCCHQSLLTLFAAITVTDHQPQVVDVAVVTVMVIDAASRWSMLLVIAVNSHYRRSLPLNITAHCLVPDHCCLGH